MKERIILTIAAILIWVSPALSHQWELDPAHSSIQFGIKHIFSTVPGHFKEFSGKVFFNPEQLEKSNFDFTVKVDSIDTGVGKRDNHLRSGDFFDTGKFPTMSFQSTSVTHKEGNNYLLKGKLTVKDVTKEVELPLVYGGEAPNPFDKKKVVTGFDSQFSISRLDYGVGNGKFLEMGVVGGEVDIFVSLELIR